MSLFRMREWWGTTPGANEEFGGGCVAVGNLDNAADGTMKIATGSFSGMLRLYAPREMNFRVEDVMLESELDAPILQLAAGHLLSDANRTALAVLHPRCLAVYSVSAVAQPGSPGSNAQYYSLTLAYEHQLERPACNMVHGAFGGTYGHELICVQSMDGLLTVIEQDRINLERKLSRFLLPGMPRSCSNPKPTPSLPVSLILCVRTLTRVWTGPLTYSPKADMLLTYTSRIEVECYKYSTNVASGGSGGGGGYGSGGARKLSSDWSLIVGEEVVCIEVGRLSRALAPSATDILIIASHTLIAVKDNGTIRTQKRIDYQPLCACTYTAGTADSGAPDQNVLIGTQGGAVLIYSDMELLWSARLRDPATALCVAKFGGQQGLIVSLGHDGALALSYLGTDPPTSSVSAEAKELNYEAMDEEHRRLLQVIRDASSDVKAEPTEKITLRAQVPSTIEQPRGEDDGVVSSVTVRLFVSYTGGTTLENVTLVASCTAPLFLTADTVVLPSLAGGNRTPTIVPFTFRARSQELPISLNATIVATYTAPAGEPRCARCDLTLPLPMVAEPVPPQKNVSGAAQNTRSHTNLLLITSHAPPTQAAFKITLETNRSPPPKGR